MLKFLRLIIEAAFVGATVAILPALLGSSLVFAPTGGLSAAMPQDDLLMHKARDFLLSSPWWLGVIFVFYFLLIAILRVAGLRSRATLIAASGVVALTAVIFLPRWFPVHAGSLTLIASSTAVFLSVCLGAFIASLVLDSDEPGAKVSVVRLAGVLILASLTPGLLGGVFLPASAAMGDLRFRMIGLAFTSVLIPLTSVRFLAAATKSAKVRAASLHTGLYVLGLSVWGCLGANLGLC